VRMGERLRMMAVERRGFLRVGFAGEVLEVEGCTNVRHGCEIRLTVGGRNFEFFLFLFCFCAV